MPTLIQMVYILGFGWHSCQVNNVHYNMDLQKFKNDLSFKNCMSNIPLHTYPFLKITIVYSVFQILIATIGQLFATNLGYN